MSINYHYKFDLTTSKFTFTSNSTISASSGYDLSDFSSDVRGTARIADWNDLSSLGSDDFNAFLDVFNISSSASLGWCSDEDDNSRTQGNKYFKNGQPHSANRAYYAVLSLNTQYSGGFSSSRTKVFSSNPVKNIKVGSWYFSSGISALVYFENYKKNGGNDCVKVNSETLNWSDSNQRFENSDSSYTLKHQNGNWEGTADTSSFSSSLNSEDVPYWVDPLSSSISWTDSFSGASCSSGGSSGDGAGGEGDPVINTLDGVTYSLASEKKKK